MNCCSCLVCIVVSCLVCTVVFVLCVLLYLSFVYIYSCFVCIVVILCVFAVLCVLLFLLYMPDCWLEVSIRKVLRPATWTQVFLGFPLSISKRSDGSQHSKLPLHASHVALQT